VRALFLRLVTSERTRAIVPVGELYELSPDPAEVHRVVDRLVRSRLLVGQTTASEAGGTAAGGSVELVHESLIHSWPLLRRWLDETQDDAVFLEQLRSAAKQWQARGRAPGLLWRGEAMQEAKLWHGRFRGDLPDVQRAYLAAVFALSVRAARRRRVAVVGAIAVLSALVVAAAVALVTIRDAQQEATAQARRAEDQLRLTRIAEVSARAEHAKTVEAKQTLEAKNTALVAAIASAEHARQEAERARSDAEQAQRDAEQARVRAERSKRLEQRSKQHATHAAQLAEEAAAEATRAGEKLEVLLAQERKRVQALEELTRGAKIIADVQVEP
jgi:hypothetical protein